MVTTNGEEAKKDKNSVTNRSALLVAVISGILGATGGPFLAVKLGGPSVFRPDEFTGSQGAVLAARVEAHKIRLATLERHVEVHPDIVGKFDSRLAAVEATQRLILSNQDRILDRLN